MQIIPIQMLLNAFTLQTLTRSWTGFSVVNSEFNYQISFKLETTNKNQIRCKLVINIGFVFKSCSMTLENNSLKPFISF